MNKDISILYDDIADLKILKSRTKNPDKIKELDEEIKRIENLILEVEDKNAD